MPENDINKEPNEKILRVDSDLQASEATEAEEDALPEAADEIAPALPSSEDEPRDDEAEDTDDLTCDEPASEPEAVKSRKAGYDPENPRRIDSVFDFVEILILTLAAVFILTSFVFRHSIVDGDSMMNTLQNHDVLIISDLFYTPKQYDIVVIEDHTTGYDHPLVKRVIAVGGDRVRVTEYGITVNGEELGEPYVFIDARNYTYDVRPTDIYFDNPTLVYEEDSYYEFVVPEGEIYVLGDHRNNSSDSRAFGTVSADAVLGKVLFRVYPFSEFGNVYTEEE